MPQTEGDLTQLLHEWSEGSEEALAQLVPLVYPILHKMARSRVWRERVGRTLQPTVLVNEVFLKLVEQKRIHWEGRTQFFGVAAMLMRRIVVDYVRRKEAGKRRTSNLTVSLDGQERDSAEVLSVNEALTKLEALDLRQARIVEMRFFAGMSNEEVGEALGISRATVKREWSTAKIWLRRELSKP